MNLTGLRWSKVRKWGRRLDRPVVLGFTRGRHLTCVLADGTVLEVNRSVNPWTVTPSGHDGGALAQTLRLGLIPGGVVGAEIRRRLDDLRAEGWCFDGDVPDDLRRDVG